MEWMNLPSDEIVLIGSVCYLFEGVTLEHDTETGENVFMGPGVVASGGVKIGKHALLGAGVVCAGMPPNSTWVAA
jgi:acetyltransferase-like isoleucine patch superfamily enzyme